MLCDCFGRRRVVPDPLDAGLRAWRSDPAESTLFFKETFDRLKSGSPVVSLYGFRIIKLPEVIGLLTHLTHLDLTDNSLTFLPSAIGRLKNLTALYLNYNNLTSLPPEIGLLTSLVVLYLSENPLQSLPKKIGQLTSLTTLNIEKSELQSLPTEIGRLTSLTTLNIKNGTLQSLPTEIGLMTSLKVLKLHNNTLTSLPQEIGNLVNLTQFTLYSNPLLSELPMSLGQIPGIINIEISGTEIDPAILRPILNQCRLMRDAEAVAILPARLQKWKVIAASLVDLDVSALSELRKGILNEWLLRLEKTKDFANIQSSLAHTVCSIVADALKNKEFQELFFNQAEANNACCQDRAAMALNEIYTSWMILCKSVDLKILTGVAKTLSLRKELQKLIPKGERESVEIFLYYESMLRERLQLVTAIQTMSYGDIGKRKWIDEGALVNQVNGNFFEELYDLPVFEKLVDSRVKEQWEAIDSEFSSQFGDCPPGGPHEEQVLNYYHRQAEIMLEWKRRKMAVAKVFINEVNQ